MRRSPVARRAARPTALRALSRVLLAAGVLAAGLQGTAPAATAAAPVPAAGPEITVPAAPPPAARTRAVTRVDVVARTSSDRRLEVSDPSTGTFRDLGGRLTAPPVFAAGPSDVYFVGRGTDGALHVRTFTLGWRRLSPTGFTCSDPSATLAVDQLVVACRGTDAALHVGRTTVSPGQLPPRMRFTRKGGRLLHGGLSGYDPVAREFYFQVVGTDHRVYEATDSRRLRVVPGPMRCYGPLAHDSLAELGAACRGSGGRLVVASATDPSAVRTLPASIVGRPGVAVDDDGTTRYHVLGDNGRLYVATQSPTGVLTGWRRGLPGTGRYGVSAASVTGAAGS